MNLLELSPFGAPLPDPRAGAGEVMFLSRLKIAEGSVHQKPFGITSPQPQIQPEVIL